MNAKRKILSTILVLVFIFSLVFSQTQTTVLAEPENVRTFTIEDQTVYNQLRSSLNAALQSYDDATQTLEVDMSLVTMIIIDFGVTQGDLSKDKEALETLISESTNLKIFMTISCDLSTIDLSLLDTKENLETLWLVDAKLEELPDLNLPNLKDLNLTKNNLSGEGALNNLTSTNFPKLTSLQLDRCQITDVSFIGQIGTNLTLLYLGDNKLNDDSLNTLLEMSSSMQNLQTLTLGGWVHSRRSGRVYEGINMNVISDVEKMASLPIAFPKLSTLDLSGLKIASLQDFTYLSSREDINIDFERNEITDFAGLESKSNFILIEQTLRPEGNFVEGQEVECPELITRILDPSDALYGTLTCNRCSISDDGTKIVFDMGQSSATVQVRSGKLNRTEFYFTLRKIPSYTIPKNLTATVGDILADVSLPKGFTWKDSTLSVGAEGTNTFKAVYTPWENEPNIIVDDIDIPVNVKAVPSTEPDTEPETEPQSTEADTKPAQPTEADTEPETEPQSTEADTEPAQPIEPDTEPETEPQSTEADTVQPTTALSDDDDDDDDDETAVTEAVLETAPLSDDNTGGSETEAVSDTLAAKTADASPVLPVTILMLVAGVTLYIMVLEKKKQCK